MYAACGKQVILIGLTVYGCCKTPVFISAFIVAAYFINIFELPSVHVGIPLYWYKSHSLPNCSSVQYFWDLQSVESKFTLTLKCTLCFLGALQVVSAGPPSVDTVV